MATTASYRPVHLSVESPTLPLPPPRELPPGEPFERSVLPDAETLVTVSVAPASVCRLRADDTGAVLHLDADDRGIVRFHARARAGAGATSVSLDCYDDQGQGVTHSIALRPDIAHTPSMSSPELASQTIAHGSVRPPLEGDPLTPSNAELIAAGYPIRPQRERAPKRFERWLASVCRPHIQVGPRIVHHPEFGHSRSLHSEPASGSASPQPVPSGAEANANSNAWSGAYIDKPARRFASITARWQVPAVTASGGPSFSMIPSLSAMVEWIGLDNAATDLYQAGTGTECLSTSLWNFTNYFMWMESLPWSWWTVPNFPVSPGDMVAVDIWVADEYGGTVYRNEPEGDGGLTAADNSVWFYLMSSNGSLFLGTYPTAPKVLGGLRSSGFTGGAAEFILERPMIDGSTVPLPFFTPTLMTECSYGDALYGDWREFGLLRAGGQSLDGDLTYLNMVDKSNGHLLAIPFLIPEAHDIDVNSMMFVWLNSL